MSLAASVNPESVYAPVDASLVAVALAAAPLIERATVLEPRAVVPSSEYTVPLMVLGAENIHPLPAVDVAWLFVLFAPAYQAAPPVAMEC